MDILQCPNCWAELPPRKAEVIHVPAAGAHCEERRHCCPYCAAVLLVEVTIADEDCPTLSRLRAIEL